MDIREELAFLKVMFYKRVSRQQLAATLSPASLRRIRGAAIHQAHKRNMRSDRTTYLFASVAASALRSPTLPMFEKIDQSFASCVGGTSRKWKSQGAIYVTYLLLVVLPGPPSWHGYFGCMLKFGAQEGSNKNCMFMDDPTPTSPLQTTNVVFGTRALVGWVTIEKKTPASPRACCHVSGNHQHPP